MRETKSPLRPDGLLVEVEDGRLRFPAQVTVALESGCGSEEVATWGWTGGQLTLVPASLVQANP